MNIETAYARGVEHRSAGLELTPHDARDFDREVFAYIHELDAAQRTNAYTRLRGAFNRGFMDRHNAIVFAQQVTA